MIHLDTCVKQYNHNFKEYCFKSYFYYISEVDSVRWFYHQSKNLINIAESNIANFNFNFIYQAYFLKFNHCTNMWPKKIL